MDINNVELIKDKEMGWCYVVQTEFSEFSTSDPTTYIILKPVFDRRKTELFSENVDLTKIDNWIKLFEFTISSISRCEYMHSLASFVIGHVGDRSHMEKVPSVAREPIISECFIDLNKKGLAL